MSPGAVDLGCAPACLSVSISTHLPPITQLPPAAWSSVRAKDDSRLLPGSAAGAQGQPALPPALGPPRRGARALPTGREGTQWLWRAQPLGRSPRPRVPTPRSLGPQPGPDAPPSGTWDAPEPGAAAKAETFPPLTPAPERGARRGDPASSDATKARGSEDGRGIHLGPEAAAAAAARPPAPSSRLPPRAVAAARLTAGEPAPVARGLPAARPAPPRPRAAAPRTRSHLRGGGSERLMMWPRGRQPGAPAPPLPDPSPHPDRSLPGTLLSRAGGEFSGEPTEQSRVVAFLFCQPTPSPLTPADPHLWLLLGPNPQIRDS